MMGSQKMAANASANPYAYSSAKRKRNGGWGDLEITCKGREIGFSVETRGEAREIVEMLNEAYYLGRLEEKYNG